MNIKDRRDLHYFLFIICIAVLAFFYFTMPERAAFIKQQLKWWGEFFR
jgi:hypothetical protein